MIEGNPTPFPDKKEASLDYDRVTRHIQEAQQLNREISVGQESATWLFHGEYPTLPVAFTFMPDVHYGSMDVDYDLLNSHLRTVEHTPNMALVFGGDLVDNFSPQHIASGMLGDPVNPDVQTMAMMQRVLELDAKSKVGAICFGNHDDWTAKTAGYDYYNSFMRDIQAPIFPKGGILTTLVGEGGQKYKIGINHTHWGNSKINPTNAAKRAMDYSYPGADITLLGHIHVASGEQFDRAGEQKIAVIGGTYKVNDTHAQKWGMGKPGVAGYTIMLWPDEKKMQLFRTPKEASNHIYGYLREKMLETGWNDPYTELVKQVQSADRERIIQLEEELRVLRGANGTAPIQEKAAVA